jgi:16S rRNA (cytosine1402-N4)-methyltransferase
MKRQTEIDPALRDLPVLPAGVEPRLKLVGRKSRAVTAEVDTNPRARSALLRVAQKIK